MPAYYYSSTAGTYTLTGAVNSSATILVLNTVSGLPTSTPFKVVVEPGQPSEEIVKVTGVAGTSLTVVRGWDGTSAASHGASVTVRHMVTAEDFTLSRAHEDAVAAHGATGAIMGTTNAQTVSNKNLANGTNTFPTSLATLTGTQTLTNKDLSTGNTFPSSLATLTGAQTLTNKVINGLDNTITGIAQSSVVCQARQVLRTTATSVPTSTHTPVAGYGTAVFGSGSMTLTSSGGAGVLTPTVAGLYRWEATVTWDAFAGTSVGVGRRRAYVKVAGAEVDEGKNDDMLTPSQSLNSELVQTSGGYINLTVGQEVGLWLFQSSGVGPLNVSRVAFSLVKVA